jgi:hypothetical protein
VPFIRAGEDRLIHGALPLLNLAAEDERARAAVCAMIPGPGFAMKKGVMQTERF